MVHRADHLSPEMDVVPIPVMERVKATAGVHRVGIRDPLGKKNAEDGGGIVEQIRLYPAAVQLPNEQVYPLIFFKNPGVFNSRSSKYVK